MKQLISITFFLSTVISVFAAVVSEKVVTTLADMTATTDSTVVKIVSGTGIDGTFYWDANRTESENGGTMINFANGFKKIVTPRGIFLFSSLYRRAFI